MSETTIGLQLRGIGPTANTTKSTSGNAFVQIACDTSSGTGLTSPAADANLLVIESNGVGTRFIFDAEGSGHADVEWVAYSAHDDLALIADMEAELLAREDEAKTERRHALEDAGVIGKGSWHMESGQPRAMVNMTRLAMLHHGALLQSHERIQALEAQNATLHAEIAAIRRALPAPQGGH